MDIKPFRTQLLKWVGNKQRVANKIIQYFPETFGTYFEPFLGSGAILGTLSPKKAIGSDTLSPLIEIWKTLSINPELLKQWYLERYNKIKPMGKEYAYEEIKKSFNLNPNGADLLFISRSCYGGVIRFRKSDGYISTPCGIHIPISPISFDARVDIWHQRTQKTEFVCSDFESIMHLAKKGDIVYCDPPYSHSQTILYGAQTFNLDDLFESIRKCKERGVYVALSIDGTKKSGNQICNVQFPDSLFEREILITTGKSMLRRFQLSGKKTTNETVQDRLLITY